MEVQTMALEALFKDRNVRNNIRTEIREAPEIGFGDCENCGKNQSLMKVFNRCLCESCCNKILNESYDFDKVFETFYEDEDVDKILSESYVLPDMMKLQTDAQQKFNGSIPDLLKSYNLNPHRDWDDKLTDGRIYIRDNEIKGGKTRVNQFIIDYDCSFMGQAAANKLVPDPDGTAAPLKVKGQLIGGTASATTTSPQASTTTVPASGSKAASATSIPNQSSSSVVQKSVVPGPGIKASNSVGDSFEVKLTKDIKLDCTKDGTTNGSDIGVEVNVNGDASFKTTFYVKDGDNDTLAKEIIEEIKKRPETIFRAFTEDDMKNGFVLNKYGAYAFIFDENSFDGNNISLVLTFNGKKYEKTRIALGTYELFDRFKLEKTLRVAMDGRVKKFYPMLFNGTADMKTSIGKAVTEFISVESDPKCKAGNVKVVTEIGNVSIPWHCDGERFQDKELTHNTLCDVIFSAFPKLIPGYGDDKLKTGTFAGSATDSFGIDNLDDNGMSYSMVATFDLNDLYDKGDIVFKMSVLDTHTDEEQPKSLQPVVYRQAGVPLADFLKAESKKIHAHYFKKSDMDSTMTKSAREKMKTPSKRMALFNKICDQIMDKLRFSNKTKWGDISIELEEFEVNKDGKVTKATVRFYDEDETYADNAKDLAKYLKAESMPFFKFKKADDSPRGMSEYGPSVLYSVSDMTKFAEFANLAILEELIFEAFGLIRVDESGKKHIYV